MSKDKILIIGANGQIGSVLAQALQQEIGPSQVITSDIRKPSIPNGIFELVDVLDADRIAEVVAKYGITQIYHLAAILSAKGESDPKWAWDINMNGLMNVLEVARSAKIDKVFYPSSIAVFGNNAPKNNTPQEASLIPNTVYGISKVAGELWCKYYFDKYGLDIRSVRFPGVIGHQTLPGGGTTDYAVGIYHSAVKGEPFECFLSEDTELPMVYMDDTIRSVIELMTAPSENISIRTSYNLAGVSFTPKMVAASIKQALPNFSIKYKPDFRQAIADSWPGSIDDTCARKDWKWQPAFDLEKMTADMIFHLNKKMA